MVFFVLTHEKKTKNIFLYSNTKLKIHLLCHSIHHKADLRILKSSFLILEAGNLAHETTIWPDATSIFPQLTNTV